MTRGDTTLAGATERRFVWKDGPNLSITVFKVCHMQLFAFYICIYTHNENVTFYFTLNWIPLSVLKFYYYCMYEYRIHSITHSDFKFVLLCSCL